MKPFKLKFTSFVGGCLMLFVTAGYAQTDPLRTAVDSTQLKVDSTQLKKAAKPEKKKSGVLRQALYLEPLTPENTPAVAFIRSVVPGLGQITNKQYWKVPIVWAATAGGFATIYYWNSRFQGYKDIIEKSNNDGKTESTFRPAYGLFEDGFHLKFAQNPNATEVTISNTRFETVIERYRRYRDLSVIGFSVGYFVVGVEAYVSAHLKNFDVTDDISMRIEPILKPPSVYGASLYGAKVQLTFR